MSAEWFSAETGGNTPVMGNHNKLNRRAHMKAFNFDSTDWPGMFKIMEEFGDSTQMFFGETEYGKRMTISVYKDKICTVVYQNNGWVRTNIYNKDRTVEELYSRA